MKIIIIGLMLVFSGPGLAGVEYRSFDNAEHQETYESLTHELRCLVCQNQTIADSNAELAADLRRQVYEMVEQGKTREEIVQFLTDRYGDFVLYKPPLKMKTGLLWFGPLLFLVIGLTTVFVIVRKKQSTQPTGIDSAHRQKIRSLLDQEDRP